MMDSNRSLKNMKFFFFKVVFLQSVKQHGGHAEVVTVFQFDSDNEWTIVTRIMNFV
jgi:hypothetical protein